MVTSQDHPRGCGDKEADVAEQVIREGSPPRMRGQVQYAYIAYGRMRITPADAGTSCTA